MMKTLYMVGGTMGIGKTTVCQQLKQDFPDSCESGQKKAVHEEPEAHACETIGFQES